MHHTILWISRAIIFLVIIPITFRLLLFPYLIRTRTRLRASVFGLFGSFKALEWRDCDSANNVIPTFRAERGTWKYGGRRGDVTGFFVYRVEGICLRYKKGIFANGTSSDKKPRSISGRFSISARAGRFLVWVIQLLFHHLPSIARFISIQLVDCRIILEDCNNVEIVFSELALGAKINFEGDADPTVAPGSPLLSPNPGFTDLMREQPLCASPIARGRSAFSGTTSPLLSPTTLSPNLSPPMSPTAFSPLSLSESAFPIPDRRDDRSSSRLSDARRRASVMHSRMTTTAGQVWTRATGRMYGSVAVEAYIENFRLLQPHSHSSKPIPNTSSRPTNISRRSSSKSIFPLSESGYDTLLGLEGRTKASVGLGFGPKKGLAGEDTLNTKVELGDLRTSVVALERIVEIAKQRKSKLEDVPDEETAPIKDRWSTRAWPRIILRALESVQVTMRHFALTHHLASPQTTDSRASSSTAISDLSSHEQTMDDKHTLSFEISNIGCTISAADSSNNERARNAFGTNSSPACKVRGVGFELDWHSIQFHCIAPGETHHEKSQLFAIRQANFSGFSSWRPRGWSREELLFANDPNLALIVGRGEIASVDCAFDIQLLHELQVAFRHTHPKKPERRAAEKTKEKANQALLPRIRMVLDVGPMMGVIADRLSEETTTISIASDGVLLGCFTSYMDMVGRRRDRATSRAAFADEEKLRANREEEPNVDYTLPPEMLPSKLRRKHTLHSAQIPDDLSITMKGDAQISVEPISVKITLSGDKIYELADVGRIHGTITGDILGRHETFNKRCTKSEVSQMDWSSLSCGIDFGIQEGIHIDLWEKQVIDALVVIGKAHQSAPAREVKPDTSRKLLDRLPSGVSARFSLGQINVFLGHTEINPNFEHKLIRGVWLQTSAVLEYALYKNRAQAFPWRHYLTAPIRAKLHLPEDITTQALAFATRYRPDGGAAALVSFAVEDMIIQPVFNGERFVKHGGTRRKMDIQPMPQARTGDDFVGWGFQRLRAKKSISTGEFSNNLSPMELTNTEQAQRPWMRVKHSRFHLTVQQSSAKADTEIKITSRLNNVSYVSDLSHVYSNMHAAVTIQRLVNAWKRPKASAEPKQAPHISIDILIPNMTGHFAFPFQEQLYFYASGVSITKPPFRGIGVTGDQALLYVPSPRLIGNWEELGRIKRFSVTMSDPSVPRSISTHIDAIRVRVPHMYQMNSLILNINVAVKSLKLLMKNFFGNQEFMTSLRPVSEEPKHIPRISIGINYMSLEAKDDPVETSLNLIWRAGLVEQGKRNALEDTMAKKLLLLGDPNVSSEESLHHTGDGGKSVPKLTKNATVDIDRARWALDAVIADSWIRRMRAAKQEQRRREGNTLRPMHGCGPNVKLPISVTPSSQTAPLFRATFQDVNLTVSNPGMTRSEIIDYMSQVSSPFADDVEFSLMVPLKIEWTMSEATCTLRDYPLPLIRVQRVEVGDQPSFEMKTTFIIAEELADDDSVVFVPVNVMPAGCGAAEIPAFVVNVAKTIMPVKMYAEPRFNIHSTKTTEFTWGNSYQPAISDFTRVMETLSHPPRDPSPKVGLWDKLRLVCHMKPIVEFAGPCHLHMKGSFDPYNISGLGAGFALAWRGNTKLLFNQPNPDHEAMQIVADELLVAIPDLSQLNDGAASGNTMRHEDLVDADNRQRHKESDASLIQRRYTKPCARFVNGTRVGFGFVYERTCRPWNCGNNCGDTDNLLHRQCHNFDFIQHQKVILRSPDAIKRASRRLGRPVDSYEGFRSDYIHFSVSLVAPTSDIPASRPDTEHAECVNSLHAAPKASHHFLSWWKLFDHKTSLPIRQGKLFPDSPPPSKKFSKSLATIKYRFDLKPLYLSHIYPQVSKELWAQGKSESLGIKARIGRFRFDAHQRLQERKIHHPKLEGKDHMAPHKPFYAVDVLADDLKIKGIRAHFAERIRYDEDDVLDPLPRASELPKELQAWFNYLDYIDADRRPFDQDPKIELVDFGDCPHVYYCKRVNARSSTARDNASNIPTPTTSNSPSMEISKFGHEKTHHCYLGVAAGVKDVQKATTLKRVDELRKRLDSFPKTGEEKAMSAIREIQGRIRILLNHLKDLDKDDRHMTDDSFDLSDRPGARPGHTPSERAFEDTIHVHCPRVYLNNQSRNIAYTYIYSMRDRKKEEYYVSHKSLRSLRDSIQTRISRRQPRTAEGRIKADDSIAPDMCAELVKMLTEKKASDVFRLIEVDDKHDVRQMPSLGLPAKCTIKPQMQVLVFKPQIALRSEATENAIVLLSVQEASLNKFTVDDIEAQDRVTAEVLSRNYSSLKGVQAFYPTELALKRERSSKGSRGLDFIPLEIFLDERSQATDYDRILLKSEIRFSLDKFNHIRLPQGLEWPEDATDEFGEPIKHLKIHQDLTTIVIPQLTLSATSKHYDALYTVITDLLMYQDPEHKHRSEAVDDFSRQFDSADRDVGRLIIDVHTLQQTMRTLLDLQQGYETNFERLEEAGKDELFKIRADLQEGYESLYTINALIAATLAKSDARAAMKTASRMNIRIRGLAWHLQEETLEKFAKVEIDSVLFSLTSNKNGSMDSAVVLGDLLATNPRPNAIFSEIVSRDDYTGVVSKKRSRKPFASSFWSSYPAIGGIPIFPKVDIEFVNIRFRIEERVGHQVVDYIFSDRIQRRKTRKLDDSASGLSSVNSSANLAALNPNSGAVTPSASTLRMANGNGNGNGNGGGYFGSAESSQDDLTQYHTLIHNQPPKISHRPELYPLVRSKSQVSLVSHTDADPMRMRNNEDTIEMRLRAQKNKMFGEVRLHELGLNLSFKGDDSRKHGPFSIPDCVDFRFKTPNMAYCDKVWPMEEIFEHVKRDIKASAWTQSGDLLSQLFKKTSLFRSKKQLSQIMNVGGSLKQVKPSNVPLSPLRQLANQSSISNPTNTSSTTVSVDDQLLSRALSRSAQDGSSTGVPTSPSNHTSLLSSGGESIGSSSGSVRAQDFAAGHPHGQSNGHGHGHGLGLGHSLTSVFSDHKDRDSSKEKNGDDDSDDDQGSGGGGTSVRHDGKLKGFIGKLTGRHKHDSSSPGKGGSTDELARSKSRGGSMERV